MLCSLAGGLRFWLPGGGRLDDAALFGIAEHAPDTVSTRGQAWLHAELRHAHGVVARALESLYLSHGVFACTSRRTLRSGLRASWSALAALRAPHGSGATRERSRGPCGLFSGDPCGLVGVAPGTAAEGDFEAAAQRPQTGRTAPATVTVAWSTLPTLGSSYALNRSRSK